MNVVYMSKHASETRSVWASLQLPRVSLRNRKSTDPALLDPRVEDAASRLKLCYEKAAKVFLGGSTLFQERLEKGGGQGDVRTLIK